MQERRSIAAEGLTLRRLSGDDITPVHWDAFYKFYINTSGACLCPQDALPGLNFHTVHPLHSPVSCDASWLMCCL